MKSKKKISIVIPVFNEEANIEIAYKKLQQVMKMKSKYITEYIIVDNGSTDNSRLIIQKLCRINTLVKGILLSRNFGVESSTQAGIDYATGDALVIYECDMQDPPEVILRFIEKWEEGYDCVVGIRTKIEDNIVMTILRLLFYKIFKLISNIDVPINAGSFALINKNVIAAIKSLPEKYRFHRGLRAWVGFRCAYITYERRKRLYGKSSYNFFGYIKHAERSFFGFSYLPLDLIVYVGLALVLLSFCFLCLYLLFLYFSHEPFNGAVALLAFVVFFGGVQLFATSMIGKYVQVIVEETKNRPLYIVENYLNIA